MKMYKMKIIVVFWFLCLVVNLAVIENESSSTGKWYKDTFNIYDDDKGRSLPYNSTNGEVTYEDKSTSSNNSTSFQEAKRNFIYLKLLNRYCTYIVIGIGIPGNLLICIAILKYKHMQSSPNIYVFNLALADQIGLCSKITFLHVFRGVIKISGTLWSIANALTWTSTSVTIWTTVGITVDRYIAVCHPFQSRTYSSVWNAIKINILLWILCLILSIVRILYVMFPKSYAIGGVLHNSVFRLICNFVIPLCIITVSYICIVRIIWKSSKVRETCNIERQSNTGKSLKISVAIIVQFIFCWGPFYCQDQLYDFLYGTHHTFDSLKYKNIWYYITKIISLLCAIIDPIVYAVVSKQFRKAFKDTLCIH